MRISKVDAVTAADKHTCGCVKASVLLSSCSQLCAAEPEASNDEADWKPQHLPRSQGPDPRARVHRPRPVSTDPIRRFDLLLGINHNCHSSVTPPPTSLFSHHPIVYIFGLCCFLHMHSFFFLPFFYSFIFIFPLQSNSQSVMAEEGW